MRYWTKKEDSIIKRFYQKKTLKELSLMLDRYYKVISARAIKLGIRKDKKIQYRKVSETQKKLFREGIRTNKGDKNPNWKGGNGDAYGGEPVCKYNQVHTWIIRHHGKATKCSSKKCLKKSKTFDWARKVGREYEKDISNFIQLCRSCHTRYDKKLN